VQHYKVLIRKAFFKLIINQRKGPFQRLWN